MPTLRRALAQLARYVIRREPVLTGGVLAGVVLAAIGWFGAPSDQTAQIVHTVCGLVAPIITAALARMAAWSPQGHAAALAVGAHVEAPPAATSEPAGGGV